jgi:hypothetical protein
MTTTTLTQEASSPVSSLPQPRQPWLMRPTVGSPLAIYSMSTEALLSQAMAGGSNSHARPGFVTPTPTHRLLSPHSVQLPSRDSEGSSEPRRWFGLLRKKSNVDLGSDSPESGTKPEQRLRGKKSEGRLHGVLQRLGRSSPAPGGSGASLRPGPAKKASRMAATGNAEGSDSKPPTSSRWEALRRMKSFDPSALHRGTDHGPSATPGRAGPSRNAGANSEDSGETREEYEPSPLPKHMSEKAAKLLGVERRRPTGLFSDASFSRHDAQRWQDGLARMRQANEASQFQLSQFSLGLPIVVGDRSAGRILRSVQSTSGLRPSHEAASIVYGIGGVPHPLQGPPSPPPPVPSLPSVYREYGMEEVGEKVEEEEEKPLEVVIEEEEEPEEEHGAPSPEGADQPALVDDGAVLRDTPVVIERGRIASLRAMFEADSGTDTKAPMPPRRL